MAHRRLDRLPVHVLDGKLRLFEAATFRARLLGLAGLGELDPGHALLLRRCRAVHTFGMRFALDLVFLDEAGRVIRLARGVPPGRLVRCWAARSVIEGRDGEGERFAWALEGRMQLQ